MIHCAYAIFKKKKNIWIASFPNILEHVLKYFWKKNVNCRPILKKYILWNQFLRLRYHWRFCLPDMKEFIADESFLGFTFPPTFVPIPVWSPQSVSVTKCRSRAAQTWRLECLFIQLPSHPFKRHFKSIFQVKENNPVGMYVGRKKNQYFSTLGIKRYPHIWFISIVPGRTRSIFLTSIPFFFLL